MQNDRLIAIFKTLLSMPKDKDWAEIKRMFRAQAQFEQRGDWLAKRALIAKDIHDLSFKGKVAVYEWSRDCDMCESDSMTRIPATLTHFRAFERSIYESAEGPVRIELMDNDDFIQFQPQFRDRAMEAYENGRGANAWRV